MKIVWKILLWILGLIALLISYGWYESKPEVTKMLIVGFLVFSYLYYDLSKAMERHQKSIHERLDIIERSIQDLVDSPLNSQYIAEGLDDLIAERHRQKAE